MLTMKFFDLAKKIMEELEITQKENIHNAARLVANSIMNGGILQAYGSGHSYAGAIEISGRAGGLIPTKVIKDPAEGMYERQEGIGTELMKKVHLDPRDIIVLISNLGRNPQPIEIAEHAKNNGNEIIVVTALEVSKDSTSRHSSGKLPYEYGDVVLDNKSRFGDAALTVPGLDTKVSGTSSLSNVLLLQEVIYEAINMMVEKNYITPVYKSANIDGGPEYNEKILEDYADRIFRF